MPSTEEDGFRLAAALFTVIDPVHVGGRFLWRLRAFSIDRYYCPDCHRRVCVPPAGDLVAASAAHVCPAMIDGQATYVPDDRQTPAIERKEPSQDASKSIDVRPGGDR
jgi:hypothetical protein